MNFQIIILTATLLVYSCNAPTKAANVQTEAIQKQDFSIISATQSVWSGGREGVKGSHYTIRLKNKQNSSFLFKNLVINNMKTPVKVKVEKGIIEINASTTDQHEESLLDVATGQEIPVKPSSEKTSKYWLEYTTGESKTIKKLLIPKFTATENQEFYP